ncbi:hypothetical protein [Streptomyces microflavus]|uniref:hypothetical protein n=1 Tax=Streptomyces microflavus TaxID=1919 RepID=UPI0036E08FD5
MPKDTAVEEFTGLVRVLKTDHSVSCQCVTCANTALTHSYEATVLVSAINEWL